MYLVFVYLLIYIDALSISKYALLFLFIFIYCLLVFYYEYFAFVCFCVLQACYTHEGQKALETLDLKL